MIRLLSLIACLLAMLVAGNARATVTASASNCIRSTDTSTGVGDPMTAVSPTDWPANALVVVGILNRTNETATVTSIATGIDGAWAAGTLRQGPTDSTPSTFRTWFYARESNSATSSAGNRTLTVEFSATISAQIVMCWLSSDLGAMTFDAVATVLDTGTTEPANWISNNVSATGAGVSIGFLAVANSQASITMVNGSETHLTTASDAGSFRTNLFSEIVTGAGNYGFEIDVAATSAGIFHVGSFLEPAAGGSGLLLRRRRG